VPSRIGRRALLAHPPELLLRGDARANTVPDAHLAAIALEHGATVATRDRGFARFAGLSWFDPLAESARARRP